MKAIRDLSIKRKLAVLILAATGTSLVVASSIIALYEYQTIRADMVRDLETQATITGANCAAALIFADSATAEELLGALVAHPSVMSAVLSDARGRTLAAFSVDSTHVDYQPPGLQYDGHRFDRGHLTVRKDIVVERKRLGSISVVAHTSRLRTAMVRFAGVSLLTGALSLLIAFLMSVRIQGTITGPILRLVSAAKDVSGSQHFSVRVQKTSNDELGILADAFNEMLERVERRDSETQKARQAAEKANRAKSEFLANMSHELRTPMHAVLSFASLGRQKAGSAGPEKIAAYFDQIGTSGERLMALLNSLLELSKHEAGRITYRFEPANLCEIIQVVVDEFSSLLSEKQLTVTTPPDTDVIVEADGEKMIQVLRNLLSNAVKFSHVGGRIAIEVDARDSTVVVSVTDEGIGVPPEELEHIFDKFVQSSRTKTGTGGTGLGLAISREVIEGHGGHIWAEAVRIGAAFFFELPRRQARAERVAEEAVL